MIIISGTTVFAMDRDVENEQKQLDYVMAVYLQEELNNQSIRRRRELTYKYSRQANFIGVRPVLSDKIALASKPLKSFNQVQEERKQSRQQRALQSNLEWLCSGLITAGFVYCFARFCQTTMKNSSAVPTK